MPYPTFLAFNVAGGLVWGSGCVLLGFVAGSSYEAVVKAVGEDITAVVLAAVVIALITWKIRKSRDERLADGTPDSGPTAGRTES
jgi:membrane protein DedA with SNARE-associated domain